jgi:hypothetical protein
MLFELQTNTECELTTFVGRTQKSGPDDVPAVTFRLKLTGVSNALLDRFSKTIRHTVYKAVEGQDQLPGVEDTTPLLQSKDLVHWAPETCLEGWTVFIARGISDGSALQMGSCKVDNFRFDFFDGGRMDVDFRVSTADVDEEGAGMLWGRQKRKVFATITAPEMPETKPVIDGTTAAFKADHPDATDLFADGAPDQHAGDFGQADDDSAGPGAGSSDDAGTGADSEGGDTDAAGDAAQFEAGMQKALDNAGVVPIASRRGRRPAAGVGK